jgi:MarR family transcriptional regulator, temperature-dependent positive regulator of motility
MPGMSADSRTDDPLRNSVFHLMRLALQEHQALWTARIGAAGLPECTKPQYALLRAALAYPGLDQASAGEFTGSDKSTVVSLVDRMERRGLLTRVNDPSDRRRRRLYLTEEGKALIARLIPVVDQLSADILARLSDSERETLVPLLLKLSGLTAHAGQQT